MATMSDKVDLLHAKAYFLQPKELSDKPNIVWVGVLKYEVDESHDLKQSDFTWFKCRKKTFIWKVLQEFVTRRPSRSPFDLIFDGELVDMNLTVGDFDFANDKLVIFKETKKSDHGYGSKKRQPLQSGNSRIAQASPSATFTDNTPQTEGKQNAHGGFHSHSDRKENHGPPSAVSTKSPVNFPMSSPIGVSAPQAAQSWNYSGYSPAPSETSGRHYQATNTFGPNPPSSLPAVNSTHIFSAVKLRIELKLSPTQEISDGFRFYCALYFEYFQAQAPFSDLFSTLCAIWTRWWQLPNGSRLAAEADAESYFANTSKDSAQHQPNLGPGSNSAVKSEPSSTLAISSEIPDRESSVPPPENSEDRSEKMFQLQNLLRDAGPEMLEQSVEEGLALLDDLKAPLTTMLINSPDAEQWITQIENLRKQASKTKTIMGVVGNTGAGKSSVINAMLDEERLVPTNCMRACTAVVTEISYNHDDEKAYRAEIEFIAVKDWEKELKILYQDLLDGDGRVSREIYNEDSDAGIAYAKIKAVYPNKTKDDIAKSSIEEMIKGVSHVLGTVRTIRDDDSLAFYKRLQTFVDSKEKASGAKDDDRKRTEARTMEFWPLIRVVRLFTKSPTLETGAVIVDLPGVHDANAARAAVAEGYMKQCTGLWIVAPINRAVDDKAAKSLLGESFKRQLKMDGSFNSVTFICSKTDDISLEEAQDSLGLEDQIGSSWEEMDRMVKAQRSLEKEVKEMQETKAVFSEVINDVDDQIEVWEELKDKLAEGEEVFAPKSKQQKRKRSPAKKRGRKKQHLDRNEDDEFTHDEPDKSEEDEKVDGEEDIQADASQDKQPLTEDDITMKLSEFKSTKKEARESKQNITKQINETRKKIKEAEESELKINSEISALCIAGRNQYSKGAIQQDFAAGIKELDQELAAEEDEENFNPDTEIRDYEEVARSLPVFCVSSRAYQKLNGRLRKDAPVPGFSTADETQIPQLQAHCKKLTETGRSSNCRAFLNKLSRLLNSLLLWASSDGTNAHLTKEQRDKEQVFFQKELKKLERGLENCVKELYQDLSTEIGENIFDEYEKGVFNATEQAVDTVSHWGAKVDRENREAGGYHWSTYKAICRRNGVYTNAQGPHEWNAKLTEPLIKVVAPGWEKVFMRRLPMVIQNLTRNAGACLSKFHRDIEARARKTGTGIASLHTLSLRVGVNESSIKDISSATKERISAAQKDINREFTPVILREMEVAYDRCTAERGTGSFARMKEAMATHVETSRHLMFQRSADEVRNRLKEMVKKIRADLDDNYDEIFLQVRRDYHSVIGRGDIPEDGELLPRAQRIGRREVTEVIAGVENRFRKVAGLAPVEKELESQEETQLTDPQRQSDFVDDSSLLKEEDSTDLGAVDRLSDVD